MSKLMSKGWMSDFLSTNTKQSRIPPIHVGWGDLKDGKLLTTFTHLPSHIYVDRPINRFIIKWRIQFEIVLGDPRKYVILKCNQSKQSAAAVVFPPSISATNLQKTYQDLRILHLRHIQHETIFTTRTATLSIHQHSLLQYQTHPFLLF